MKTSHPAAIASLLAAALVVPVVSYAQADAPKTRAQVQAELVQLENAGYHLDGGDAATYPAKLQAAEAKVDAQEQPAATSYGGTSNGASQAGGSRVSTADWNTMYNHP